MATQLKKETTHVVSYWHVPGGCDYTRAEARIKEASSSEEADAMVNDLGTVPPAMAFVLTKDEYTKCH